jgi:peptidoglycan/xylan/chitin deacetylase (PgdA/CDA1 family)
MTAALLLETLNEYAEQGRIANLWLRDDDAIEPTPALERLTSLSQRYEVPVTLAVIPAFTGKPLAETLDGFSTIEVAVHGWSHRSYAGPDEKKRELGSHRPLETVLGELKSGYKWLSDLHGLRFVPMLVPPWNRIDDTVIEQLSGLSFKALSVFGAEKPAPLQVINTHVDVIEWHGTRGGRDHDVLFAEIAARVRTAVEQGGVTGVLTHHLVHDESVWAFLEKLFELTANHPACHWRFAKELIDIPSP